MKIDWIRIKGFRNFDDETIHFADKSLIIGANDVGKTNLIYTLRLLFDKNISDGELELNNSDYNVYTSAENIEIIVCLGNITEDCLKSVFAGAIEKESMIIKYINSKNGEYSIFCGPTEDLLEEKNTRFYLKRLNLEYVSTNRDLFSFMKRERTKLLEISKNILAEELTNQDKLSMEVIQSDLENLNDSVDNLNYIKTSLKSVNDELSNLSIHNEDQDVKFVTGNSDAGKLLDNLDLCYSANGSRLTIGGDGRNNQIFLATWIAKQKIQKTQERVTLFVIEEPEAHLHPHQQRKLSKYLIESFEEQLFITTHSPQIATEFRPSNIVRLYSKNKITKVAQGGCSNDIAIKFNDFGYRLNAISSEVFFSNAIFLVEGPSEKIFYTALASKIGIDLDRLNINILSVDGVGFKPYIKICKALEIAFVMRTDDDVFPKEKKKQAYNYFAGISRVMGIYNELLSTGKKDHITEYWKKNKEKNEWIGKEDAWPQEAVDLNNYIRDKLNDYGIFLSIIDLEDDLVNSKLLNSLSTYYDEVDKVKLIKIMQKRKAENMLEYIENNMDEISILKDDDIATPLHNIKKIVEGIVRLNDK